MNEKGHPGAGGADDSDGTGRNNNPAVAAALGVTLVLAALGGLAWLASRSPEAPAPSLPAEATAPGAAPGVGVAWAPALALAEPVLGSAVSVTSNAPDATGTGTDICGLGHLPEGRRPPADWIAERARDTVRSRERVQAALAASADEVTRAAGLVLRSGGGPPVYDSVVDCTGDQCPAVPEKAESPAAVQARITANAAPRDALARMALVSTSPQVYALAWQTCRSHGAQDTGSACQMLSVEQWARLDGDNAVPWLELAGRAQARGDSAAVAEAMFRVSKAHTVDFKWGSVAETVLKQMPADVPPLDAMQITTELLGLESSWQLPAYAVPLAYCKADTLLDSNRLQQCAEIADVIATRGRALADVSFGTQLGRRVGWSAERVDAVSLERDAMMQALAQKLPPLSSMLSCGAIQQQTEHVRAVGRVGELAVARQAMQQSGQSVAELARLHREGRERLVAQFQPGPAASSAAGAGAVPR